MEKQSLILHVGMPKTGSSALQTVLYHNRDFLAQQDIEYGAIDGDTAIPKHQFMVNELLQNRFVRTPDILGSASKSTLILSSEGLTNHLYDFSAEALKEFCQLTREFDSKIFIVLRYPLEWARSYYKQAVINPSFRLVGYYACTLTFSEFVKLPRIKQLMAHQALLHDLQGRFEIKNLISADFDGDWLQMFCNLIGIPSENLKGFAQVNQSPPEWVIELLRQVNRFALPEPRRLAWKAVLQGFADTNHVTMKKAHKIRADYDHGLEEDVLDALVPATHDGFELTPEMLADFRAFAGRG